jgi:hypothetical protein
MQIPMHKSLSFWVIRLPFRNKDVAKAKKERENGMLCASVCFVSVPLFHSRRPG